MTDPMRSRFENTPEFVREFVDLNQGKDLEPWAKRWLKTREVFASYETCLKQLRTHLMLMYDKNLEEVKFNIGAGKNALLFMIDAEEVRKSNGTYQLVFFHDEREITRVAVLLPDGSGVTRTLD